MKIYDFQKFILGIDRFLLSLKYCFYYWKFLLIQFLKIVYLYNI
jgi:hypothetical protein